MKNVASRFRLFYAIAILLLIGSSSGCKSPISEDAPEIPPKETFLMDLSFDTSAKVAAYYGGYEPNVTILTASNYNFAAGNVFVWNAVITVGLAVPVAAFVESFHHAPIYKDGEWVWSYNVRVGEVYTAELHGKIEDQKVKWAMYISKDGGYQDFNWFTGESDIAGTEGTWTLNNKPEEPTPLLGILWHRDKTNNIGDITYTNIVSGGPEEGGYISYATTLDTPYDAYYDIYNKGKDDLINIEWNRTTIAGRVKNLAHFGDVDWHYWDSSQQDTIAPAQ